MNFIINQVEKLMEEKTKTKIKRDYPNNRSRAVPCGLH